MRQNMCKKSAGGCVNGGQNSRADARAQGAKSAKNDRRLRKESAGTKTSPGIKKHRRSEKTAERGEVPPGMEKAPPGIKKPRRARSAGGKERKKTGGASAKRPAGLFLYSYNFRSSLRIQPIFRSRRPPAQDKTAGSTKQIKISPIQSIAVICLPVSTQPV